MRKVRYLIVIAAVALLSAALAGSALPAAAHQGAATAQHIVKKPKQQKATPQPAQNVRVAHAGVRYTVTWAGVASKWTVTLTVGTRTMKATVAGSAHKRVFTIRGAKGTPKAVVMGIPAATTTKTTTTSASASSLAFTGTYSGQASSKVSGTTANLSANGTGSSNLIGAGSITGTGTADSSQQPCPPFGGTGTITGAKGTIKFSVVQGSNGCGDDGGHNFSLVGHLQIVSATGALAGVTGQLRLTGNYSRDDGTFSIKLTGTLTK